jgi:hypothetical protein
MPDAPPRIERCPTFRCFRQPGNELSILQLTEVVAIRSIDFIVVKPARLDAIVREEGVVFSNAEICSAPCIQAHGKSLAVLSRNYYNITSFML